MKGIDVVMLAGVVAVIGLYAVGVSCFLAGWRGEYKRWLRRDRGMVSLPTGKGGGKMGWKTLVGIIGLGATLLGGEFDLVNDQAAAVGQAGFGGLLAVGVRHAIGKVIGEIRDLINMVLNARKEIAELRSALTDLHVAVEQQSGTAATASGAGAVIPVTSGDGSSKAVGDNGGVPPVIEV